MTTPKAFAYSRITNPSVDYLEQKLAALEHGKGGRKSLCVRYGRCLLVRCWRC